MAAARLSGAHRARAEPHHQCKAIEPSKVIEVQDRPAETAAGAVGILPGATSIITAITGTLHSVSMTAATTTTTPMTTRRIAIVCATFTRVRAGAGVAYTSATSGSLG